MFHIAKNVRIFLQSTIEMLQSRLNEDEERILRETAERKKMHDNIQVCLWLA